MLWRCIDMQLSDELQRKHISVLNGCAQRLPKVTTEFGRDLYIVDGVLGKPQRPLLGELRVSPRNLPCGVSLPGRGTGGVGVDERVEGAAGRQPGFILLDVYQVEQAAQIRPLVEPHCGVAIFDDSNQAPNEVDAVGTVITP